MHFLKLRLCNDRIIYSATITTMHIRFVNFHVSKFIHVVVMRKFTNTKHLKIYLWCFHFQTENSFKLLHWVILKVNFNEALNEGMLLIMWRYIKLVTYKNKYFANINYLKIFKVFWFFYIYGNFNVSNLFFMCIKMCYNIVK